MDELEQRLRTAGIQPEVAERCARRHDAGDTVPLLRSLLIRALWSEILEGDGRDALSVRRWHELSDGGFPFLDASSARRAIACGADPNDLDHIVRSAQVLTVFNVLNLLDEQGHRFIEGVLGPELAKGLGWTLVARDPETEPPLHLDELHASFEQADPTGRFANPPSSARRSLAAFPDPARAELLALVAKGAAAKAALAWRKQTGDSLEASRAAVQTLIAEHEAREPESP